MVAFLCISLLLSLFVSSTEPGEPPCITSAGFQFLLLDTPAQLWYFMLQYLQTAQVRSPGPLASMLCSSQVPLRDDHPQTVLYSLFSFSFIFPLPFLICLCPFFPRAGVWI